MQTKICVVMLCLLLFFLVCGFALQDTSGDVNPVQPTSPINAVSNSSGLDLSSDIIDFSPPELGTLEWETYWRELREKLISKTLTLTAWEKQVASYFEANSYDLKHTQLWDIILQQTPEFQSELLLYSAMFVSIGMISEVQKQNPNAISVLLASQFLLKLSEYVKENQVAQLADIINIRAKKTSIRLTTLWNSFIGQVSTTTDEPISPQISASLHETIIYFCLAMLAFLPPNKFSAVVQLPEPMRGFFNDHGILVFDGGMLTEPHYRSLKSIFQCLTSKLHNIQVIIVPDGVGISATKILASTRNGIVVDIPFLPMELMSNPMEFPQHIGPQVAPEFSLGAVVQIVKAIQWTQFKLRPELLFRRNAILMNARTRGYNYTRPTIRPELYFSAPDELLPMSAYLWFLNSEKTLQMTNELLKLRQYFATDVYLLLADMLSEGRDVTLTFYMDETGFLSVREAPVIRAPIDEGYPSIISILPDRLVPTFDKKSDNDNKTPYSDEIINQPITQNAPFNSGFDSPNDEEKTKLTPRDQIIIQPKGN